MGTTGILPSSRMGLLRLLYKEERIHIEDRIVVAAALKLETRESAKGLWRTLAGLERPEFPLRGRDVLEEGGIEAGPQVGGLLGEVEAWWIAKDFVPNREACRQEMRRLLRRSAKLAIPPMPPGRHREGGEDRGSER